MSGVTLVERGLRRERPTVMVKFSRFEVVPAPFDSVCDGCHRQAEYVVWQPDLDDWRCVSCLPDPWWILDRAAIVDVVADATERAVLAAFSPDPAA
jgi:hypothetical protein